jgi:hypothetical protein
MQVETMTGVVRRDSIISSAPMPMVAPQYRSTMYQASSAAASRRESLAAQQVYTILLFMGIQLWL